MSTTTEETAADGVEEQVTGPLVVHVRTMLDVHYYCQFATPEEAQAFDDELHTSVPGIFEIWHHELTDPQDVLNQLPPAVEPTGATPTPEGAISGGQPGGIPDDATLEQSSRATLDQLLVEHGEDPAAYANKGEAIVGLQNLRDA